MNPIRSCTCLVFWIVDDAKCCTSCSPASTVNEGTRAIERCTAASTCHPIPNRLHAHDESRRQPLRRYKFCLRQVPLCHFLADQVPALARFRVDDATSVLDALVDAAEALQVAELQQQHPDRVDALEQVRTHPTTPVQ